MNSPANSRKSTRERTQEWVRNSGMSLLLLLLVGTVFVAPVLVPYGEGWRLLSDILLTMILLSGILAVVQHPRFVVALAVMSAIVIVLRWFEWLVPGGVRPLIRDASTLGALLVLAWAVGINVFARGHALGDRIFGAIVLYLLVGLTWGVIYLMVDAVSPGAFAIQGGGERGIAEWIYFSFVTLTTVGYGDITPVARSARSLAILEALIGQLYPAVIIARLVSLQGTVPDKP